MKKMATRKYDFPAAQGLVVCGDIHGKFEELVYRMTNVCGMEHMVVIVAGDCGFGFHRRGYYDEVYHRVLPRLERSDCHVVFVRGNHDNPAYFDGEEISMKRWVAVSDYSTVCVGSHRVLCVGGGTSVDRKNRESYSHTTYVPKPGHRRWLDECTWAMKQTIAEHRLALTPADYWPQEAPYLDEDALFSIRRKGRTIDTVVTHVAPSMCEDVTPPLWLDHLIENDPALPDDMKRDRETMDALLERLRHDCQPVRHWLYGHYHHSWQADIDGISYTMLRELEMKELR